MTIKQGTRSATHLTIACFAGLLGFGVLHAESPPKNGEAATAKEQRSARILGPEDLIVIRGMHADEVVDKPFRVEANGNVSLPLVGHLRAGGLTIEQFESELTASLKKYYIEPQISVSISDFRSQPVSVVGAVTTPGIHQLQGNKTILDILSMVGGVRGDAGPILKITRRIEWGEVPVPGAHPDESGEFSLAELSLKDLIDAKRPTDNILVRPLDVISVPASAIVYVIGQVRKSGGFVLGSRSSLSVLEALSLAEGFSTNASPKNSKVLRSSTSSDRSRTEIPLDVQKILAGKAPDMPLKPDDILFIPSSAAKNAAMRTVEAAIQIGTGFVIYKR